MKTKTTRGLAALLLIATAMFAAACGSDDKTTPPTTAGVQANAVDRAFASQMIPHHQMAVQMAKAAQKQATHAPVKRLANAIVTSQTKEITRLRAEAEAIGVEPAATPTSGMHHGGTDATGEAARALGLSEDEMGMSMDMGTLMNAEPFDRAFIDAMMPHHAGAIAMARAELAKGDNAKLKTIATAIVAAQQREIKQMTAWRTEWYGIAPAMSGSGM